MRLKKLIRYGFSIIISMPKTIWFNLRVLPLKQALKLPVFVGYDVKIAEIHRGMLKLNYSIKPFSVIFGFGGSLGVAQNKGCICFQKGEVIFNGKATLGKGCSIRNNGILEFGDGFSANKNCFISCSDKIIFGKDVMLGWNVAIRDSDGHYIVHKNETKNPFRAVTVGDHVWICSESHVLKGSKISSDSVVGYKSLVTKEFDDTNVLIAGHPAKIIQHEINWIK